MKVTNCIAKLINSSTNNCILSLSHIYIRKATIPACIIHYLHSNPRNEGLTEQALSSLYA